MSYRVNDFNTYRIQYVFDTIIDMKKPKFRLPEEMPTNEERTPVSARLKVKTKKVLQAAANKQGLRLGSLIEHVLDDYVDWLEQETSVNRRG